MSLATYSDLETAVANWLAREGDTTITANVADFITLCEARMAYGSGEEGSPDQTYYSAPLRIRAMERSQAIPIQAVVSGVPVGGTANALTLTPSGAISAYARGQTWNFVALHDIAAGGVTCNISGLGNRNVLKGSALAALGLGDIVLGQSVQLYDDGAELILMPGSGNAPLPANYLAMRSLYLDTMPRRSLEYIGPEQLNKDFASVWQDQPTSYTIEADCLRFGTPPDSAYNVVALYYQKFGALSSATNWMMTNAPSVYLYGSLMEAAIFLGDDTASQRFLVLYRSACNALQAQDTRDRHSGSTLRIRNDTGNP